MLTQAEGEWGQTQRMRKLFRRFLAGNAATDTRERCDRMLALRLKGARTSEREKKEKKENIKSETRESDVRAEEEREHRMRKRAAAGGGGSGRGGERERERERELERERERERKREAAEGWAAVERVLRHGGFAEVARVLESLVTNCLTAALVRKQVRQHTSAYVSIRQHTSAYVSIRLPHRCARHKAGLSLHVFKIYKNN
jgi:hypothetical protein